MDHYIGEKEIFGVTVLDKKTPGGNEMVEVTFVDGTKEQMPKKRFELIVTEEASDATSVFKKVTARVGSMLFGMLHEYGIKWGEVNSASDAMVDLLNNGFKSASDIKWGVEKEGISLIEINDVLVEDYAQKNTDGSAS